MKKILLITVAILILGLAVPVPAQGRDVTGEQLYLWGVPEQDTTLPERLAAAWPVSEAASGRRWFHSQPVKTIPFRRYKKACRSLSDRLAGNSTFIQKAS